MKTNCLFSNVVVDVAEVADENNFSYKTSIVLAYRHSLDINVAHRRFAYGC